MGRIVEFSPEGGDGKKRKGKLVRERLSQEEFLALIEPFRNGLRKFYPTQVKDILGMAGFGEKLGNEVLVMGILIWEHLRRTEPIASTFLAVFINEKLEKVSFLEAKNNYWDWNILIETYQTKFNTKEMLEELQALRMQMFGGENP